MSSTLLKYETGTMEGSFLFQYDENKFFEGKIGLLKLKPLK
jgi:hypothetical protein